MRYRGVVVRAFLAAGDAWQKVRDPAMGHQFTILLVEDDTEVRDAVAEALVARGFRVLTASDGYQALRLLAECFVHVMFTDIRMPGLSGYELAAQARLVHVSTSRTLVI
jgi:CheY-like chemotaxis protein